MWKKILLWTLVLALVLELALTLGGFAAPGFALKLFEVAPTTDTFFLAHIVAWFCLLVTVLCGLAIWEVYTGSQGGWTLSYVLGIWWIGIGLALFFLFGRAGNLILDSLKGLIIVVAAWKTRRA